MPTSGSIFTKPMTPAVTGTTPHRGNGRKHVKVSCSMATIIDGKAISKKIRAQIAVEVAELAAAGHRPGLAVVLVGDNPASKVYVTMK